MARPPAKQKHPPPDWMDGWLRWYPLLTGLLLGISVVKLGSPVIFEGQFPPPRSFSEIVFFGWPLSWGMVLFAVQLLISAPLFLSNRFRPHWIALAAIAWFLWQCLAAAKSINDPLSWLVIRHFAVCLGWFLIGMACFRIPGLLNRFWLMPGLALVVIIAVGFDQRFGALQKTRETAEAFLAGTLPLEEQQALEASGLREMLETESGRNKLLSERIFSTLFYPNTLAAVLLLIVPPVLGGIWFTLLEISLRLRLLLIGAIGFGSAACLVWSGSKSGWLLAMLLMGIVVLRLGQIPRRVKIAGLMVLAVGGLAGLIWKNYDYFSRGATSVSARFDYWNAAAAVVREHPLTGSGPGTFAIEYGNRKEPEMEMARLAHNDYVQQASDSGFPGLILYATWVLAGLGWTYRRLPAGLNLPFFFWTGLLLWFLHSLMEFNLYIPGPAWMAFAILGMLLGSGNAIDNSRSEK